MIGYLTEVNLKTKEVIATFRGQRHTFAFNHSNFPLVEALKVSAEYMHNQIQEFLQEVVDHVEQKDKEQ